MAKKTAKSTRKLFGIIGLGRFGFALARSLAASGNEIIAIDRDSTIIQKASAFTENAYQIDELTCDNLEAVGIQNCDTVIVAIGEKLDTSLLTTMNVKKLGVKRVISKAKSEDHGALLELMGAEVAYPERDMGERLAARLVSPDVLEYISLSDKIDISEIKLSPKAAGKTVIDLNVRSQFGLNIIAIRHDGEISTDITPQTKFDEDDSITVVGTKDGINRFQSYLAKV